MRKITLASGLMAVLCLFGEPLAASAQEVQLRRRGNPPDQERITREVNLIQLTVVVRDKQGHPIEDLKAEDFVVTDQGQRQEIKLFERPLAPGCLQVNEAALACNKGTKHASPPRCAIS